LSEIAGHMNRVKEIKHWLEEGNLYRAEKAIQSCGDDLKPEEKEEFEKLLREISILHYRLLAGKAVLSKDESLLKICIQKIQEKNAPVEGLQNSLNEIKSAKKAKKKQRILAIILGFILLISIGFVIFV
jgi:outer membrane PBP1 activator LpoA protein